MGISSIARMVRLRGRAGSLGCSANTRIPLLDRPWKPFQRMIPEEPSRIGARRIGGMGTLTEDFVDTLISAYDDSGDSAHSAACRLLFDHWACTLPSDRALPTDWRPGSAPRQAAAACQLDRDDIHWGSMTHPGSIIWPTALDIGLRTDAEGAAVLRAAILGYEVRTRLAQTLAPSHRRDWHATATAGTVGAA